MEHIDGVDVVELIVVASFSAAHLSLSKLIFNIVNHLSGLFSLFLLVAAQLENLREIRTVSLLLLLAVGVGVQIVVAVGQTRCAGAQPHHIQIAVLQVGVHADAEERIALIQVLVSDKRSEISLLAESLHLVEVLLQWSGTLFVQANAIHSHIVEVSHLLPNRAESVLFLREILKKFTDLLTVSFSQIVKHTVA